VLAELQISNFAIIHELSVSFEAGLTVVTGETGAGKSILVNAINLLLGSRGSADLIRTGSEEATVTAQFNLADDRDKAGFDAIINASTGSEVVIRRVLSTSGRNRVYVNGQLATVGLLAELCRGLVSISGQHEHQLFLEPEAHLQTIDRFGGLESQRQVYEETFSELKKTQQELRRLKRQAMERRENEELRRFQLEEINKARIQVDEEVQLAEERERLRHVEKLQEGAAKAHGILYAESGAVLEDVSQCHRILADLSNLDQALKALAETLEGIKHQVEDVSFTLRDYSQQIQADPARLEWVEERLHTLQRLMHKYGDSTAAVLTHADLLRLELENTESDETEIAKTEETLENLRQRALSEAQALSKARRQTARRLSRAVAEGLATLDMANCQFEVVFDLEGGREKESIRVDNYLLAETGMDNTAFFFSANPGEDLRPMAKIASGGELSRIVLALKELLARQKNLETLIFDEVDAGIGGRTADRVGQRLKALSERHQVVCITHLPQIACYGDYHYVVTKSTRKGRTITAMKELSAEERLEEIARMLGGKKISAKTRAHAGEMLEQAQKSAGKPSVVSG
jgi:DNA repair protein RecN (Recombination protein N)